MIHHDEDEEGASVVCRRPFAFADTSTPYEETKNCTAQRVDNEELIVAWFNLFISIIVVLFYLIISIRTNL